MRTERRRGGSHRPRPLRLRAAHLPFAGVCVLIVVGLVRISIYHWREGSAWIALAMLAAAALRAVLRRDSAGLLAIRGRLLDTLAYAGFGLVLLYLTLTIVGGPLA
jgi:hypothetical protein